jgi:hypothetical protein
MFYAFDIETMPNSSKLDSLPEPEIKTGNLKDPAKIEEKRAEARAEQIGKMALNPLYGRIAPPYSSRRAWMESWKLPASLPETTTRRKRC